MKMWVLFPIVFLLSVFSCAKNPPEVEKIPEVALPVQQQSIVQAEPEPASPAPPQAEGESIQLLPAVQVEPEPAPRPQIAMGQLEPVRPAPEAPPVQVQPEPAPVETTPAPVEAEPVQPPPEPPPVVIEPTPVVVEPAPVEPVPDEPYFNPTIVSREEYDTAKSDIQTLVDDLNRIIRAGNYNTWLTYLGDDYRRRINSREFLSDLVEKYPVFRGRINTTRDYFNFVVVPSRANDRVDDIEFVTKNEVKAYTEDAAGQMLVLYFLENINGQWKITN